MTTIRSHVLQGLTAVLLYLVQVAGYGAVITDDRYIFYRYTDYGTEHRFDMMRRATHW
jgi:hypothetical protein